MISVKTRDRQPEWMDQPDIDRELHAHALKGLARVNLISGAVRSLAGPITDIAAKNPSRTVRILDVASGGGDIAIGLKKHLTRRGVTSEVTGCDLSETAIRFAAAEAEKQQVDVSFIRCDALGGQLPEGFDVVCSTLFMHHLDAEDVVRLLQSMQSASRGIVLISDLVRSRLGYLMAKWGIRLLTTSKVCHVDGPLSVRGAWTIDEAHELSRNAGLASVTIRKAWPERFLLVADVSNS